MGNSRYCIKEIKDLERLQQQLFQQWRKRYREKETQEGILEEYLEELTKYKGIAEKGDLEALYRCFELNALIELEEHCNIERTGTAFSYLEEAARHGSTKAVKVYIVMILKGFDIRVNTQKVIPCSSVSGAFMLTSFVDIVTFESTKYWKEKEENYKDKLDIREKHIGFGVDVKSAERALGWFSSEAKKEIEVQRIIGWVKEERKSLEELEEKRKREEEKTKKVKRVFLIVRIIGTLASLLTMFLYYYYHQYGLDVSKWFQYGINAFKWG